MTAKAPAGDRERDVRGNGLHRLLDRPVDREEAPERGLARGGATLLLPAVRGRKGRRRPRGQRLEIMRILDRAVIARGKSARVAGGSKNAQVTGMIAEIRRVILGGRALPSWQATLRGRGLATWLVEPLCGVERVAQG
jgi:hypothetical protein